MDAIDDNHRSSAIARNCSPERSERQLLQHLIKLHYRNHGTHLAD